MLLNTFKSEWTKLRTTKSLWFTTVVTVVLSWAVAGLTAAFNEGPIIDSMVVAGLQVLGLAVILIQAIMVVTTEYRYGLQVPVYMANPNRLMVAAVKYVLYAVFAAVLTFLIIVGAVIITKLVTGGDYARVYEPWNSAIGRRIFWTYPVGAALVVLFGQGVAWLVRQTAGAVAICLIFFLGLDGLVAIIPKVGDKLIHFSPFGGLQNWLSDLGRPDAPWGDGSTMYFVVFLVWGLVLWITGVILLLNRDA